jgi:hypothetical protein
MSSISTEIHSSISQHKGPAVFREIDDISLVRKLTVQIYLGAIERCKMDLIDPNRALILFETKEHSTFEFVVRRTDKTRRRNFLSEGDHDDEDGLSSSKLALARKVYEAGLATSHISPIVWCLRVTEYITWKIQENLLWLSFGRCLYETHREYFRGESFSNEREAGWMQSHSQVMRNEYRRIGVEAATSGWAVTEANSFFTLCASYPQVLAFPSSLSLQEISLVANGRSMNRLPCLVWLHPYTKVPSHSEFHAVIYF